ncbi:MAG: isoamylase early set domain-containing protein [Nitrospiria bacterium]
MIAKKHYLKSKPICKTKFVMPKQAVGNARSVNIVGDFNQWDTKACPMKRLKNGSFSIGLDLPAGKEYQYRYLIDGKTWENDWSADKYVPSVFGPDNSVIVV